MRVSEWIQQHPGRVTTASPDASLEELLDQFLAQPRAAELYVVDDGQRVIGHISRRRIAHLILAQHRPVHTRRQIMDRVACGSAREIMRAGFPSARPEEDLDDVLHRQLEHDVADMPVLAEDGSVLGVVNLSEILRAARRGELDDA